MNDILDICEKLSIEVHLTLNVEPSSKKAPLLPSFTNDNSVCGVEFEYTIVSEEESDLQLGKISVQSPIGKGLLGKKKGEEVSIDVPSGELKFKILNISL